MSEKWIVTEGKYPSIEFIGLRKPCSLRIDSDGELEIEIEGWDETPCVYLKADHVGALKEFLEKHFPKATP